MTQEIEEPNFNVKQQAVHDAILEGKSVAVIAGGGTGKSYILKHTLPKLTGVAVVAPTGAAAVEVGMGATTIHKLFGFKPTIQEPQKRNNKIPAKIEEVLKRIKVLVVDEVGAVRLDLFEAMDYRLRKIHNNDAPFGGVQVILTGDTLQTSPVLTSKEALMYQKYFDSVWFFKSDSFKHFKMFPLIANERNLNERQQRILKSVRTKDKWTQHALKALWEEGMTYDPDAGKVVLCQFNKDADKINEQAYELLEGEERVYFAKEFGKPQDLKQVKVASNLKLKVGLKVMIVANCQYGLYVNGDLGTVVDLYEDEVRVRLERTGDDVIVEKFNYEVTELKPHGEGLSRTVVAAREQLPLKYGYAFSIHKMQGRTLDSAVIDMGSLPEKYTMNSTFYVAISRVRDTKNLSFVRQPRMSDIKIDKDAVEFYENLYGETEETE